MRREESRPTPTEAPPHQTSQANTQLVLRKKDSWQLRIQSMARNENSEQQCWRCHCTLQPEQIRRRLVNTAASRGTHVQTGATVIPEEFFELVTLCDDCVTLFATQQREREQARARRDAWWGRLLLAGGFIGMLAFGRLSIVLAAPLAWLVDRFRMLGPIVLLMVLVFVAEYLLGLRPHRMRGRVILPWVAIICLGLLWGIWRADAPRWPFGWMARKTKSAIVSSEVASSSAGHPLLKPVRQKADPEGS